MIRDFFKKKVKGNTVHYKRQATALQTAYKFARPKTQSDITQGRANATDPMKLPKGTIIR